MALRRLRVVRRHGEAVEAVADDGEGPRVSAWPGEAPPRPPRHPSLARPLRQSLHTRDRRSLWLELRPPGALLSELPEPFLSDIGSILLDLAEALTALHAAGLSHGSVDAEHVVVGPGGRAVLIGVGARPGSPEQDSRALRMLMAALWPMNAPSPPPDPGEEPPEVIAEAIEGWLESELPGHSPFAMGGRSLALQPHFPDAVEYLDQPVSGRIDEVRVNLGPERPPPGLLDPWTTGTASRSREQTAGPDAADQAGRQFALLARLLSPSDRRPKASRFDGKEAEVSQVMRRWLAEEPLDCVPLPAPQPSPPPLRVVEEGLPEAEPEPARERPPIAVMVAVVALILAALAWILR